MKRRDDAHVAGADAVVRDPALSETLAAFEGGTLRFADRRGDMIETECENVASIRTEECLLDHLPVRECASVGL